MNPPKKGEKITAGYLLDQWQKLQKATQNIDQTMEALRNAETKINSTRTFAGKVTSGGTGPHNFVAYTAANGVYQPDPSPQAEGCSNAAKPYAAIPINNMLITSGTHCVFLKTFDGASGRFIAIPVSGGTVGSEFDAIIQTSATGSFPSWHYQIKAVVGYDGSLSPYNNARYLTSGAVLSAISGMDTASNSYPYVHGTGAAITSATGKIGSSSCVMKPFGPYAYVSVRPLLDKSIGTVRNIIKSSENSAG